MEQFFRSFLLLIFFVPVLNAVAQDDDGDGIPNNKECNNTINSLVLAYATNPASFMELKPSDVGWVNTGTTTMGPMPTTTVDISAKFGYPANSGLVVVTVENAYVHTTSNDGSNDAFVIKGITGETKFTVSGTMNAYTIMTQNPFFEALEKKTIHIYDNASVIAIPFNQADVANEWQNSSSTTPTLQYSLTNLTNTYATASLFGFVNMNISNKTFGYSTTGNEAQPTFGVTFYLECDQDKDGKPNRMDLDSDNDGLPDAVEGGADLTNPVDTDGDGLPDFLDIDSDNDGIVDIVEWQSTSGYLAPLGIDTDGDGWDDRFDTATPNLIPQDTDRDGIPDYIDTDSDNDGKADALEGWDTNGNGVIDNGERTGGTADADKDGLLDGYDNDLTSFNPTNNTTPVYYPRTVTYGTDRDWRSNSALPITFGSINAKIKDGQLFVDWFTEVEKNNAYFYIEVSKDGKKFERIKKIETSAENGDSSIPLHYFFNISLNSLAGMFSVFAILGIGLAGFRQRRYMVMAFSLFALACTTFYSCNKNSDLTTADSNEKIFVRIAQVDKDGTVRYSKIVQAVRE